MPRKCNVVIQKPNGKREVCDGEIEYWKTVSENKERDRKVSLYKCSKCGLLYPPAPEI